MDMEMSSSMATCNTSMLWNWYTIDSCFLAESWHVSSQGAFAASCIGTILLVMILEALRRFGREYDDWILRGFQAGAAAISDSPSNRHNGGFAKVGVETTVAAAQGNGRVVVFRASPLQQVIRSIIHAVSLGVAYIVMLLLFNSQTLIQNFTGRMLIDALDVLTNTSAPAFRAAARTFLIPLTLTDSHKALTDSDRAEGMMTAAV
ncbi:hypothetical protein VMCG_06768 [Cytospora schulzeri]|uniref:Copper transport protein n=1 Tax=Cytospora schulzeri TaxID=448051 RepID=A0A423W5Y6_9PEZI|nr:hypothetical protein VMCG_06768 [Valsa malicola]